MRKREAFTFFALLCLISLTTIVSPTRGENLAITPPPTPRFTLTEPLMNKIIYVIGLTNQGNETATSLTLDIALPKAWGPDSYIEMKEMKIANQSAVFQTNYLDRENSRFRVFVPRMRPNEQLEANITFYSLKYKVEYTRPRLMGAGYPEEYAIYTQPENYIESNHTLIVSKAQALMGAKVDTFRIAQRMYDFVISYLSYVKQQKIRGALWALKNGRGDCTEFGTLFVALLRAVGIPARTVSGFVSRGFSIPPPPPLGAVANATHLWSEFYVDGYGWIPVDPTFGQSTPEDHFAILWARYLPFLKGPSMKAPEHSLISLSYIGSIVNYIAQLLVSPLKSPSFSDQTIINLYHVDNVTDTMRRLADRAYNFDFNITDAYPSIETTYESFYNATNAINKGDSTRADLYLENTVQNAQDALNSILRIVETEARMAVNRAWPEARLLGALGGENYLRRAQNSRINGDYVGIVKYSYYARKSADQAPSILVFIGPVLLCGFTIWIVNRKVPKKK